METLKTEFEFQSMQRAFVEGREDREWALDEANQEHATKWWTESQARFLFLHDQIQPGKHPMVEFHIALALLSNSYREGFVTDTDFDVSETKALMEKALNANR